MVTIRKFTQYLIAIGIASLLFSATLVSESTKFFLFSQSENPFDQALPLESAIDMSAKEKGKEWLSPSGEFLILFPESKIDFSKSQRKIVKGDVFYSSLFFSPGIKKDIQDLFQQKSITEGQLQIGDVVLQAPQSSIFIHYNDALKQTEISTWGHQAALSWEGLEFPFIIPAHTKVHIKDTFVSTIKNKSYEEQKEALAWENINQEYLETDPSPSKEKILLALSRLEVQQKRMNKFALFAPQIWNHSGGSDNFFGKFLTSIEVLQDRFAIGLSQTRNDKRKFLSLVRPFVRADGLIRTQRATLGGRTLQKFETTLRSVSWKRLMQKNKNIAYQWNSFLIAHNAWVFNSFDAEALDFKNAWDETTAISPKEKIPQLFFSFENLVTKGLFKRSRQELVRLKTIFEQSQFSEDDAQDITNFRRLLGDYLKREQLLQDENSFELFTILVKLETGLYEDPKEINAIKIEIVHQIFPFLQTFLEDQTKIEFSRILLQLYQELSFDSLVEQEGSQILIPEEQELVSFLVLLGDTGLTYEEIQRIKEENELQKIISEQIDNVQEQKDPGESEPINSGQLQNAKYLNELLESIGVPTESIYFSTNRKEGITTFKNGKWKGRPLSGSFYYPTQFFKTLTIGAQTKENFHARFLNGFLLQIEDKSSGFERKPEGIVFVSQTTPKAVLERKLLQELLSMNSFEVSRENILILDAAMAHFRVIDARLSDQYTISFDYDRDKKTIESVTTIIRSEIFKFKDDVFELTKVKDILPEKINILIKH